MKRLPLLLAAIALACLLAGCGAGRMASMQDDRSDFSVSDATGEADSSLGSQKEASSSPSSALTPSVEVTTSVPATSSAQAASHQSQPLPISSASPAVSEVDTPDSKIEVTLSVDCSAAVKAGNAVAEQLAPDGWLLPQTRFQVEPGTTVFDLLKQSGLVVAAQDSMFGKYVYSIQSLAEKACGGQSGWVFTVDGKTQNRSSSKTVLTDGARVEWFYTVDGKADSQ